MEIETNQPEQAVFIFTIRMSESGYVASMINTGIATGDAILILDGFCNKVRDDAKTDVARDLVFSH